MSSAATARSPSPGPAARPCCGLRRSADSNPFRSIPPTPDPPQRSASVGKNNGGGRASLRAEKENDSHHQRDAARTPNKAARYSTGGGGGAKSFMAPTFSASSKAVAASPSPRKKILGERNNDAAHPVASSRGDLLAHGKPRGPPVEEALGAPRRLRLSLDGAPTPPAAAPVVSHGASLGGEVGEVEVEKPVCEVHRHHDEPGDAAAPYDPKTNFLSPRPQYLRYKPNPRVEQYRRSGSMRRLEDGFPSESSDDTTTTEEEGLSEEEHESSALAPASDAGADPVAPVAAGVLQPDPAPVSPPPRAPAPDPEEPAPTSPPARVPTPELEAAANPAPAPAEKKKKSSSALRFILVAPLVLVMFIAASFVCVPPPPGSPVMPLSKVSDYFLSVQELHPVELAAWLKQWSSSSLDFVTSYWNALVSSREQEFFGPHIAANLSAGVAAIADDVEYSVGFYYSTAETRPMPTEQEPISVSIFEQELEIQEVVSAGDTVTIAESEVQEMVSLVVEEVLNAEMAEEVSYSSGEEPASSSNQDLDIPSQSELEPAQILDDTDVPSLQQDVQTDESLGDQEAPEKDQEAQHGQKLGSDMWSGYSDKLSKPAVAGSVLVVLIVSAALAFLYMRQNPAHVSLRTNEPAEQVEEAAQESAEQVEEAGQEPAEQLEQVEKSDSGSSKEHTVAKSSQLQDPMVQETDRIGGSGASQYSSSLSSGLGRRRKDKGEQSLQSFEPMSRRESTSSYGSFTTYEKISAKKKKKEDEAMTPVRRSSRLRNNQVKSPEA
ncbi:hypothetical protein PR202_ga12961 [Eleusine coracana subsp. coracana]|uniref:Uncharacterized protein n=1 Tax=Eleusine coracana subsp. coracana TaxID=191504 RepID=A0AAV5CDH8_ELECO|nr:hypothetical protein PR202_ga12961 [Eleusine coracana subsp. coracana]